MYIAEQFPVKTVGLFAPRAGNAVACGAFLAFAHQVTTMNRILTTLAAAAALASGAAAQVSFSQNFDGASAPTGYTGNFSWYTGTSACGGAGGAMRKNLYSSVTTGNLVTPQVGTSIGGTVTLTFDYKVHNWSANTVPTPAPFGTITPQYGATATGPWTNIGSFTDETQVTGCINKTFTFNPPAGPLFIKFDCVRSAGTSDSYWNFDNIAVSESAAPCSGTPTPGNTVGPVAVCQSENFTLSLQNSTTGAGVSYQWYYGPTSTGPWLPAATTPTMLTNQVLDTWYYCDVTCGSSTGSSTPVLVPMGTVFPQDFSAGVVNPNCWSVSSQVGTSLPNYAPESAFAVGTGSVRFNFYSISALNELSLTSPDFAPTVAGDQVYFDVAGVTYTGGEVDHILLEESNDGGTTWNLVVDMNNAVGGVLNTLGVTSSSSLAPTASQWASLAYPLTAGTNRIRFHGVSDFGNNVFLDNISVGVLPSARHTNYGVSCASPAYTMTAAPAPVAGTTFTYTQNGIPEAAPSSGIYFGVVILSVTQNYAGTPLNILTAGAIDSPCNLHVNSLDLLVSYVSGTSTDSSVTFNVPLGAPAGFLLYSQAVALIVPVAPNNAGIVTSNGVRSYINSF